LNGKYSNTTCILKFDQSQTNPRFSINTPEPQKNRKTTDLVKNPQQCQHYDCDCLCHKKVRIRHTAILHKDLVLAKCANMRCAGVDWLVHTTLGSNSTVWCD